ncbi:hypothetical protein ACRRTK_012970 [Alexandromys fortis]
MVLAEARVRALSESQPMVPMSQPLPAFPAMPVTTPPPKDIQGHERQLCMSRDRSNLCSVCPTRVCTSVFYLLDG